MNYNNLIIEEKKLKILYVNWIDYLEPMGQGGGVTQYIKNIFNSNFANEHELFFLCSGWNYSSKNDKPYIQEIPFPSTEKTGKQRFELINSSVLAPGYFSFFSEELMEQEGKTQRVFFDFIRKYGTFDIIHFHNFEGLPIGVFSELKNFFPNTKLFFSAHNYFPICPQVNLWFEEKENCINYNQGEACTHCLKFLPIPKEKVKRYRHVRNLLLSSEILLKIAKSKLIKNSLVKTKNIVKFLLRKNPHNNEEASSIENDNNLVASHGNKLYFRERRLKFIQALNSFDVVTCVSKRVKKIYAEYGVIPDKLHVNYIGTMHADRFEKTASKTGKLISSPEQTLVMTYLGYMRVDKGFYFLLSAYEKMPRDMAAKIGINIVAKFSGKNEDLIRINALKDKFKYVNYQDGYTHDQLDSILAQTTIGVVPVLWEDNLPQVAIETHCRKIPLLCSDLGGPSELSNCEAFKFQAGNYDDFFDKVKNVFDGLTYEEYWQKAMKPLTMQEHMTELTMLYQNKY